MPSPKDGTAGTLVPPADAVEAKPADDAQPGEVETVKAAERQSGTGKYGSVPAKPFTKQAAETGPAAGSPGDEPKKSWIAIHLVDTEGEAVPGEPYQVTLPDGSVASGTTNAQGKARVDGFPPGPCKVTFPKLDKTVVNPK